MDAGSFTLAGFYERRARRILPALFVVVAVCAVFAWMWFLPLELQDFAQSVAAVATFSSNLLFWRQTSYFAPAAELKPLLHTWSLGVEEQFYLLFTLFVMLICRLSRRRLGESLAVAALVSFGLTQWGAVHAPAATFYLLPTRGWEILLGAVTAVYLTE